MASDAWEGAAHAGPPSPPLSAGADLRIQLTDVSKRYGDRTILDRVSLTIQPGETVALIGPSGGGKSTLLRCLNGLSTFDSGRIQVGDHVLTPASAGGNGSAIQTMRRTFGMVFQDFQLFPHLTALQNIVEAPLRVLGLPRQEAMQRAGRLLEIVGLSSHAHAWPRQLSGGQKQRIAIARALAMQPRGLLCDEITSALDPELKHEVLEVLEKLKSEGMTLIVVTHEIGFARRAADRVVVLADGRILEDGPPTQVLDNPGTDRVRAFLSRVLA
ncbi:MAG: amino acid ABC transporter ATP-binding protein [Planctomycetes bacterium]|nr:amino acid ABC transporter ATP-binding protein [Planctomycetota bacterium]